MKTRDQLVVDVLRCDSFGPALMLKITRPFDSLTVGFTTADTKIVFGGVTYQPNQSFERTAFAQKVDFSSDNADLTLITSDLVTESDLLAGLWTDSDVEFFMIPDRSDLTLSTLPMGKYLGSASRIDGAHAWSMDLRGYGERLSQARIGFSSIQCRNRLGDDVCRADLQPAEWLATTAYAITQAGDLSIGDRVRPTTYNGLHAKCTVAGTSGGTEPAWPLVAQTVVDGTVTWEMYEALTAEGTVDQVYDRLRFEASLIGGDTDRFRYGKVTWITGANLGLSEDVRYFDQPGGAFVLVDQMPRPITVGDTFEAVVGCSFRIQEDCKTRFDNVLNFLGEPFLPGTDATSVTPNAR